MAQLQLKLLLFLKGQGGGGEREGETTFLGWGICEPVEGGQQKHPVLGVGVGMGVEARKSRRQGAAHNAGAQKWVQKA